MITLDQIRSAKRVLCLGAHSDDIEIGAGGTVLKLLEQIPSLQVTWVVFSGDDTRHAEAKQSFSKFTAGSTSSADFTTHTFRDGFFPAQHARVKAVFEQLKPVQPDLIFTHTHDDRHQDHRVINELTWNTFRSHLILEYEIPKWDGDMGRPNCYISLDERLVARKVDHLISCFKSQRSKHWFDEETFRSVLRIRGLESNSRYAEAFLGPKLSLM